jgi:hypothetical protein
MPTNQESDRRYKIVCVQHGVLSDKPKDWIAADLVAGEHEEQSAGCECQIFHPEDDEFEQASSIVENAPDDGGGEVECRHNDCSETFPSEASMFGHLATHGDRRGEA